jgi:hypothetical protein
MRTGNGALIRFFITTWLIIGSYAYSWYVLDQSRHELQLMEQRFQNEADRFTQELEAKLVEKIFKEGRRRAK